MPSSTTRDLAGLKLRCRHGHWEFASFELRPCISGGFVLAVPCDLGHHYLAVDSEHPERIVVVTGTPYTWPNAMAAIAARDRFEQQEREG